MVYCLVVCCVRISLHNFSLIESNGGKLNEQQGDQGRNLQIIWWLIWDEAWEKHICDSDAGGCRNSQRNDDGDDEDGDDGYADNGGIHGANLWRVCPSVIRAGSVQSCIYVQCYLYSRFFPAVLQGPNLRLPSMFSYLIWESPLYHFFLLSHSINRPALVDHMNTKLCLPYIHVLFLHVMSASHCFFGVLLKLVWCRDKA